MIEKNIKLNKQFSRAILCKLEDLLQQGQGQGTSGNGATETTASSILDALQEVRNDIETQLPSIISEQDDTQLLISALNTLISDFSTNNGNLLNVIGNEITSIDDRLKGTERTLEVSQGTVDGVTDSGVQSVSILFKGSNGTLDGVVVDNNRSFSFSPNKGEDSVGSISYTVPTTGQQRVIISYVK